MNPRVSIVGCQRSGTTLPQAMVDADPRMAVVRESRFIDVFYQERRGLNPGGDVTPELPNGDVELFEAADELLDELGHGRPVPEPGAEAAEAVSHVREPFYRAVRAAGERLPREVAR